MNIFLEFLKALGSYVLIAIFPLLILSDKAYAITENPIGTSNAILLDPQVINGKQYVFHVMNVEGHQFLGTGNFEKGSLTIKGEIYENQNLRYDIYNQQLTLQFENQFESKKIIVASDAWLTRFTIGDKKFELINDQNGVKRIYQTLGDGNTRIIYAWKKDLRLNSSNGIYSFTRPFRSSFILIDGTKHPFRNNRSFVLAFRDDISPLIKKYLRQNRIKVSRANELDIEALVNFCNSILVK